jgi:hypothetical protein
LTTAPHWFVVLLTVMLAGHVIWQDGFTVTLNVQVPVSFAELVAVQVTTVVPTLKLEPDGGEHDTVAQLDDGVV